MKRDFRTVTEQDLSYAQLADETIDFGYISRKDQREFNKFLEDKKIVVKDLDLSPLLDDGGYLYRTEIMFVYTTAKGKHGSIHKGQLEKTKHNWYDVIWIEA